MFVIWRKRTIVMAVLAAILISGINYNAPAVYAVTISRKTLELKKGETKKLKVSGVSGKVKWSSSNKKVATVSSKGMVKTKKAGTATIKAKCVKKNKTLTCKLTVYNGSTPSEIKKKILALKSTYKHGARWTNDNHYYWKAIAMDCSGCIAFAGTISDKVFGKNKPIKKHINFAKIKSGDHIRIGNQHSVIVISKSGNKLTLVEGNLNDSIYWGRKITKAQLMSEGFYVETRY